MFARILLGAICGLFGLVGVALSQEKPGQKQVLYLSYEKCMGDQVARFSSKASSADEAISGARASCSSRRSKVRESVVLDILIDVASSPSPRLSEGAVEARADRVMLILDERMRDALVKRYLESK